MELDTIAMIAWQDGEFKEAPQEWFSGTELLIRGSSSDLNWLRGKFYDNIICSISNYTLYTNLNNKAVNEISQKLNEYMSRHIVSIEDRPFTISVDELKQLNKWFKIASEKGCFLNAWY